MARLCTCKSRCQHLVPTGTQALLPPHRLLQLERFLGTLVDAADAFDSDSLILDPECHVHASPELVGDGHPCSCRAERVTAVEFIQALQIDVKSAAATVARLDHSDNRRLAQQARRRGEAGVASA